MGCGASAQDEANRQAQAAAEEAAKKLQLEEEAKKKAEAAVSKTGSEAAKKAKDKVAERMKDGLEKVKENAAASIEDPEMMTKILDVVGQFQQSTLQDERCCQVLQYSLCGFRMEQSLAKGFSRAVQGLTGATRLSKIPELADNTFGFEYLVKRAKKVVEKLDEMAENGDDDDDDEEDLATTRKKAKIGNEYEADRLDMVEFLSGCYDLICSMPDKVLTKSKLTSEQKTIMAGKVGAAAFAVKVFDFSKMGKELKRVAFVGPESVGKSTVINYITSAGRGEPFMAVSEGMGTQICCLISDAPTEKLYLMKSDGVENMGSGQGLSEKMDAENKKMKKKKKIGDISAFRATKPWSPPFEVEVVDVPGIKPETRFESVLALSICSTICLCLGDIKSATGQLKSGQLKILCDIAQEIPDVQLMCLVTRDVKPTEFSPKQYQDLLKECFPKARSGIMVMYANFRELADDETRKTQVVSNFFKAVDKHVAKEIEPHRVFCSLAGELDTYLRAATCGVHAEMDDYFTDTTPGEFDRVMKEHVTKKLGELKIDNAAVVKQMKKAPIAKQFAMTPKNFPVFTVGVNSAAVGEVTDEVLVAQELLFECRIAIISWLQRQGENLHEMSFANNFDAMCEMTFNPEGDAILKKKARQIVCDNFCNSSDGADLDDAAPDRKKWWEGKYAHKVGPFLRYDAFPWIIIGYYLIRSEQKNKRLLFEHFLLGSDTDGEPEEDWAVASTNSLLVELDKLPEKYATGPEAWIPKCQEKMNSTSRHEVYQEIFNCMELACRAYEDIVNTHGLCHAGKPLDQLFEVSFVMIQRLCVTKPFESEIQFTGFAKHLKQAVKSLQGLKKIVKDLKEVKPDVAKNMCQEALELMRQAGSDKIVKWKKIGNDLEEEVEALAILSRQLSTGFNESGNGITIITPRMDSADIDETEVPESTSAPSLTAKTTETIEGWQILLGGNYKDCDRQFSSMLTKWKLVENRDKGYFKTDRQKNYIELSEEQANQDVANGNTYVFRVDMLDMQQVNMSSNKSRQLKPVGQTSVSVRSTSGAIGGGNGNMVSMPDEPEGSDGLSSGLKKVNATLAGKFTCSNPTPNCPGDMAYAKNAIKEIRKGGSRVVVYYRRTDEYSTDPVGIDQDVLSELAMEPHVGTCFVIWCAPPHISSWANDKAWQKWAGDVKIRLLLSTEVESKSVDLLDEVEREISDTADDVENRIASKEKKIKDKTNKFQDKISEFLKQRTGNEHHSAADFQKELREPIRYFADERKAEVSSKLTAESNNIEIKVPTGEVLFNMPEFLAGATDRVKGESAASMNELKCRAFLSNLLLGQTLTHAEKVAQGLYDGAFMKVLDKVGEWFCMDGKIFLDELDAYIATRRQIGEEDKEAAEAAEDNKIYLIRDFINRDHFTQMFAGCTLWNIMPMLYALVLPVLWEREGGDQGKGGIGDTMYKHNRERAIDMLKGAIGVKGDSTASGMGP